MSKLPTYKELLPGLIIDKPGNSANYKTGDWASLYPETSKEKCIACGVCWIFCPDNSRYLNKDGYYDSNLDYCKGCGICARECISGAIVMKEVKK